MATLTLNPLVDGCEERACVQWDRQENTWNHASRSIARVDLGFAEGASYWQGGLRGVTYKNSQGETYAAGAGKLIVGTNSTCYEGPEDYGTFQYFSLAIPKNSVIQSALWKPYSAGTTGTLPATFKSKFYALAEDDAVPMRMLAGEAAGWSLTDNWPDEHYVWDSCSWHRQHTAAVVEWDIASPSTAWVSGTQYASPDLKSIFQELVNRPGWKSGNRACLIWANANSTVQTVYNANPNSSFNSIVTGTEGGGSATQMIRVWGTRAQDVAKLPQLVITF